MNVYRLMRDLDIPARVSREVNGHARDDRQRATTEKRGGDLRDGRVRGLFISAVMRS